MAIRNSFGIQQHLASPRSKWAFVWICVAAIFARPNTGGQVECEAASQGSRSISSGWNIFYRSRKRCWSLEMQRRSHSRPFGLKLFVEPQKVFGSNSNVNHVCSCVFVCIYIYISLDFSFEQCAFSHRVIYLEPIAEHNSCYSSSRSGPSSFDIVRW